MRVIRRHVVRLWTHLSASPRTVHFRWMSFIDHVDHAAPRAPRRWTTVRPGRGRCGAMENAVVDAHTERSMRVHWFGCAVVAAEYQGVWVSGVEGWPGQRWE